MTNLQIRVRTLQGNQQLLQDSIIVHLMELTGGKNGTKKKEAVLGEITL
ncbi:hypothetical protein [Virgibacillus sp.]|nr:hypothetical protein [Virgibacillus sp.]